MMIQSLSSSSSSSCSGSLFTCSTAAPRVSTSSRRISCFLKSGARSRSRCSSLFYCASELRSTAEIIHRSSTISAADIPSPRTFLDARTEQDLLLGIQKETEDGRLPANVSQGMEELYLNYRNAVLQSGHPQAHEIIVSNMAVVLDRIFMDVRDPFQFLPYHEAIREPFDYYTFGQKYIRPLIDFRNSYLGNSSLFSEMEKKLHQGDNIILISNHQTEADPAVISLLLETTNPFIAENMICVAGDRVVTDPLCKPFSMGRNLLCVYSKKHMNDDPELIDMKKRANTKSLKEMALLLRAGSKIIWIAPSGGRDRPKPNTKEWYPSLGEPRERLSAAVVCTEEDKIAPFDASSIDNMRRLTEHAGVPGHIYPLAVLCYDIMPPPAKVEKDIGEKREISFHGVGLSIAPSISHHEVASAYEDPEEAKMAYTQALYSSVLDQYNVLKSAIHGKQGLNASTPTVSLSQPWQ